MNRAIVCTELVEKEENKPIVGEKMAEFAIINDGIINDRKKNYWCYEYILKVNRQTLNIIES